MNDTEFAAYNIVNQIADFYSEHIPSQDWVEVRQASNEELWAFAEKIIEKLVAGVRADQAEKLIQQISVEAHIEEMKPYTDTSSGRWGGLIAATAIIRAVALTPTTEETP